MKIFFLTQFYFDLHKPILAELERQGHEVFLVQDVILPRDPYFRQISPVKRFLWKVRWNLCQTLPNYWRKKIETDDAYNEKYDLLLCIDGTSFHPFLLQHLKGNNPQIKASLYLWDTNKYYDFFKYNKCFDKVQTFDLDDAIEEGVNLLPSYWCPSKVQNSKYKLLMVGSDHDDRIDIVTKIYNQLQDTGLSAYIRIIINEPKRTDGLCIFSKRREKNYMRRLSEFETKKKLPFTSVQSVPIEEIVYLIDSSDCILDTDKPIQTGVTQRVIWALARGKKVISTNYNLKRMPFYNDRQIRFIDRDNPIIDVNFINNNDTFVICNEIANLRIDKWIHLLIDI